MVEPGDLLPANLVFHPLKRYLQCVAFSPGHPFARLRRVPLERVGEEPLIVYDRKDYTEYIQSVLELLAPVTKRPRIAAECDGLTTLIAAIVAEKGVAIVPEVFSRFVGNRVRLRPIYPTSVPLVVGYAHRVDVPLAPMARRFISALKKVA
jgi:DNA-binding transcriptional LysR family regulator